MLRQLYPSVAMVLLVTVLAGVLFPFAVTLLARTLFPVQAGGSLIVRDGVTVGSSLIGQPFSRPEYFHARPSAAGGGYDGSNSGGTNLGPTSEKLLNGAHRKLPNGQDDPGNFDGIRDLAAAYRSENGLGPGAAIPADAVTRSASGLDPDISPENARIQAGRVARSRHLSQAAVLRLVAAHVRPRQLGLLGEPRVNVLQLNLDLDRIPAPVSRGPFTPSPAGSILRIQ